MSLATAWAETAILGRRAAAPLFAIALLLIALPAAALQAVAPVTAPGGLPAPGLWLLVVPVVLAASLTGALAISRLSLYGEGAGAALGAAGARLPALLGAALLVGLGALLLMGVSVLLAVALALPAAVLLAPLALILFCWVRLLLLTPAAAAEPGGPFALIRRAWALSRGRFAPLLGVLAAVLILSLLALAAAGAAGGLAARLAGGQPQPDLAVLLLVLLLSAVLQAAIGGLFSAFLARLYAQLA